VLSVESLDSPIKGKVLKKVEQTGDLDFMWSVSHYCKPFKDAAGIYIPSRQNESSFEGAKQLLFMYIGSFTDIEVTPNNYF
jgi:hypothetical protein